MTVLEPANTSGNDAQRRRGTRRPAGPVAELLSRLDRDSDSDDDSVLSMLPFVGDSAPMVVDGLLARAFDADRCPKRRATLAWHAAGLCSGPARRPSLLTQLAHDDEDVQVAAAMALGSRGNEDAIDALLQAVRDGRPRVRAAAVQALADVGGARGGAALATVLESLVDLDEALRRVALHGLRGASPERAEPALVAHLVDDSADVRLAALTALRDLASLTATTPVRALLVDADVRVRLLSLSVLERHGGAADRQAVQERVNDADARVRAMARDAVRALGGEALL